MTKNTLRKEGEKIDEDKRVNEDWETFGDWPLPWSRPPPSHWLADVKYSTVAIYIVKWSKIS